MPQDHQQVAVEIIDLLESYGGSEYIGEPVTKLEHMVQSAELAVLQGMTDEMVIAALLHDIGHICVDKDPTNDMDGMGIIDHELIGANYLKAKGFSERITESIANHVNAKRYLCWKNSDYYQELSDASKSTLHFQGGPMTEDEALMFENGPYFDDIVQLRLIDEKAKVANKPLPLSMNSYQNLIELHLKRL